MHLHFYSILQHNCHKHIFGFIHSLACTMLPKYSVRHPGSGGHCDLSHQLWKNFSLSNSSDIQQKLLIVKCYVIVYCSTYFLQWRVVLLLLGIFWFCLLLLSSGSKHWGVTCQPPQQLFTSRKGTSPSEGLLGLPSSSRGRYAGAVEGP